MLSGRPLSDGGEASTGIVQAGRRRASPAAARQLAVVDEGLRYHPDNVQLLHARALSLKTAGDFEGARRALENLSRRHPENAHTWHAMGTLLQELGRGIGTFRLHTRVRPPPHAFM